MKSIIAKEPMELLAIYFLSSFKGMDKLSSVCWQQTLLSMLGTLDQDNKSRWPKHLFPLVYAYNCAKHSTTGFSPFLLMFGREPHLPIDVALGVNSVSSG